MADLNLKQAANDLRSALNEKGYTHEMCVTGVAESEWPEKSRLMVYWITKIPRSGILTEINGYKVENRYIGRIELCSK